jgi:Base plate wedge protein 53
MAISRYKYFSNVYDAISQHNIKGLPTLDLYSLFGNLDSISYKIPLSRNYRPDLIAFDFYGDASLYWAIVYANGFHNSPEDFVANAVIQIPLFDKLISTI